MADDEILFIAVNNLHFNIAGYWSIWAIAQKNSTNRSQAAAGEVAINNDDDCG